MAEPAGTFRMELSCRVFLVSYPSSKQQRTVDPEPANSARFRSAKPSCSHENNGGEGERTKKQKKTTSIRGYAVSPRAEEDSTAVSSGRNTSHTHRNGVQRPLRAGGGRLPSSPPAR